MAIRKGIVFLNTENDRTTMAKLVTSGWTGCGFKSGERYVDYCYATNDVSPLILKLGLFFCLDESDRRGGLTMAELQSLANAQTLPQQPAQLNLF